MRFLVLFLVVTTSEDRIYTIYICEMHLLCLLASFSGTLELTTPFFLELRGQKVDTLLVGFPKLEGVSFLDG